MQPQTLDGAVGVRSLGLTEAGRRAFDREPSLGSHVAAVCERERVLASHPSVCESAVATRRRLAFSRAGGSSRLLARASSRGVGARGRSTARSGLAVMAAPTAVFFPAGPVTRHAFIELPAADVVVTATPFLAWEPAAAVAGAPPRMGIRLALAIRAFISRCKSSPLPADVAAAQAASPYRWRFTVAFWIRLFDELKASGVFGAPHASLRSLDDKLKTMTPVNPAQLEIVAADWLLTPDFVVPAGAGAAAAARRAVMAPMRYLHLVSAYSLEAAGPVPYLRVAELAGYLRGCATVAAREDDKPALRAQLSTS